MNEMKTIIFGSKGTLGQELAKVFADDNLVCLDRDDIDITDFKNVAKKIREINPDLIINSAAYTNVNNAEKSEERDLVFKINAEAPRYLAGLAEEIGAKMVHFSTDFVFNGESRFGYDENSIPNPINVYGESKLLGEELIKKNLKDYYIIRLSRLFGRQASSLGAKKSFVDFMIELAGKQPELRVVDDKWGKPTYAPDLAKAVYDLVNKNYSFGIYHITNEGISTWYELAKEALCFAGIDKKIIPVSSEEFSRPAKEPTYSILRNTKYLPLRNWQEALKEYLN